jgi:NADPH-dependent ferric siderophore reductase
MAERQVRKKKTNRALVRSVERITPHVIRVVLGGDELAGLGAGEFTDHYVKLLFAQPGVSYPQPLDMEQIRRDMPREQWPRMRTYTVRCWDPQALELAIDVVHHGDVGLAGPWAARVLPGEEVFFMDPGGAYAPSEHADWHLLVGDESALPAIAASLERLPVDACARVFVEVEGTEDEQKLASSGDVNITWLHRKGGVVGEGLVEAVSALEFLPGSVHAFVHGEANFVKKLRHLLRVERGVPREQLSISGYWRSGSDEDGWQSTKGEWNRQVDEEEAKVLQR